MPEVAAARPTRWAESQPMMNALARLDGLAPGELPKTVQAMGTTGAQSGLMALFSSHPPIEQRIAALQTQR